MVSPNSWSFSLFRSACGGHAVVVVGVNGVDGILGGEPGASLVLKVHFLCQGAHLRMAQVEMEMRTTACNSFSRWIQWIGGRNFLGCTELGQGSLRDCKKQQK